MTGIDQEKLAAARAALGMTKDAGLASALKKIVPLAVRKGAKKLGTGALIGGGLGAAYGLGADSVAADEVSPMQQMTADQPSAFSPTERMQFERHGLDPDRLKFLSTLSSLRQGMNLDRKLFEQALAGQLPSNLLSGTGEEDELESYA